MSALLASRPTIQRGFGDLRVAEGRDQEERARRRARTVAFFDRVPDERLRAAYVSRLRLYLVDAAANKQHWDLEVMEQIVSARAPDAAWHPVERAAFEQRRIDQDRSRRIQKLPWYQRQQLEALETRTSAWTPEEQLLARDMLWRWIDLLNAGRQIKEIKADVADLVSWRYEFWLRAIDEQRLAWFRRGPSTRELIKARGNGDRPGVSWFADGNSPGVLRLQDLAATMRLVGAGDDIAPVDAVSVWVREYRKRTNREYLDQEEYLGKVMSIVNLGTMARAGLVPPRPLRSSAGRAPATEGEAAAGGMKPPTPARSSTPRLPATAAQPAEQMAMVNGKPVKPTGYGTVYHGDDMSPAAVKASGGFPAKGSNWDLVNHSEEIGLRTTGVNDSALRGASRHLVTPDGEGGAIHWGKWVYEIRGMPTYDLEQLLQGRVQTPGGYRGVLMVGELETAIPARIPLSYIVRYGRVGYRSNGRPAVVEWRTFDSPGPVPSD